MDQGSAIADFDDPGFDPFVSDEEAYGDIADTHARIARLREKGAVHRGDLMTLLGLAGDSNLADTPHVTVLGHAEISHLLARPAIFSNDIFRRGLGLTFGESLSVMNPPDHGRYRRIFQKAFLPHTVKRLGDQFVEPIVNRLIDGFQDRGEADLVAAFTLHYPFQVIYRQLALPEADIAVFHKLAVTQTQVVGDFLRYGMEASRKLGDYFAVLVEERRRAPGDDLVSELVQAEADGERLPDMVVISFLRQLVNAAGDTTYRGTGTLLAGLLSDPAQLEAVRNDRGLIPQAIEEALRWDGPVMLDYRSATCDTDLGGVAIPEGAIVDVALGAANRDPAIFEDPDRFDIHRPRLRHCAFGHGPHVCIGQHLARVEMTRALNALLDRLPGLRLDPCRPPPEVRGVMLRSVRSIHVTFD